MSGITNMGIVGEIGNSKNKFPKNSLTIDIFGNVFYRRYEFGASDDVGIYWNEENNINSLAMLYIQASLQKSLNGKFSYGHKLRASQSHNLTCFLPQINDRPDYEYMAKYIEVIQKIFIKNIAEFVDSQLKSF